MSDGELATVPRVETSDGRKHSATRLEGIDLARALAFLGMVFVNFRTTLAPASELGEGSQDWLTWLDTRLDGRAAATFVTLAGIGVSLMSRRARASGDPAELAAVRRILFKRAAFLFPVGLLYWSIWPADILHYYGVFLAVGALLLVAPDGWLLKIAAGLVVAFVLLLLFGPDYSEGWDWEKLSYHGFWTPRGFVLNLLYNGFHPVIPWLAFFLLGMWLGRCDLGDPETRKRLLITGFVSAAVAETLSRFLMRLASQRLSSQDALAVFGTAPMPPMPLYMIAASGTAVVVIILSLFVAERFAGAAWLAPLIATGQLALTLYVGHVVVGLLPLEVFGVLEGHRSVALSVIWGVVFCIAAVVFAHLWRGRYSRGPLESLMRRLTGG